MAKEGSIKGLKELEQKLIALGGATAAKILRTSTRNAMTPVLRQAELRIPVGDEAHRTYKGNLVAPGFAKRSITRTSRIVNGRAKASIGVKKEAFYAVSFVEMGTGKMDAQEWLVPAFLSQLAEVEKRLAKDLKRKIEKAVK